MLKPLEFYSESAKMAADLYLPEDHCEGQPLPGIILCHGFAGIKEFLLPNYATCFAKAGYAALTFDYRSFGASEGERGRLVPAEQIVDIRNAITLMETLPEIDRSRIGLWGSSFGGANIISTAALDHRVRCIVPQLTFGNGERMVLSNLSEPEKEKLLGTLQKAKERLVTKNKNLSLTPDQILTDAESKAFYQKSLLEYPGLQTKIPLLTLQYIIEYQPETAISKIKIPVLIIGADHDIVCPVAESHQLFAKANQPKELLIIEGAKHYDVYFGQYFEQSSQAALNWFKHYL